MTIIAFDGTTLVADGRCTRNDGSLVSDCHKKLHKVRIPEFGECVIGLCGAADSTGPFLKHLETKGVVPMDHFKCHDAHDEEMFFMKGIAITRKGKCYEFTSDGGWFEVEGPNSVGSGELIAQHYLIKGCDAITAVVETCKTELSCGGILIAYDWKTNKFTEIKP